MQSNILKIAISAAIGLAMETGASASPAETAADNMAVTIDADSVEQHVDVAQLTSADSALYIYNKVDTIETEKRAKRDWSTWAPNPRRAMWLAVVLPGAGQIYNRKYWKLPIVYGGFMGCIYAWRWNNQMYRDYSQAYMDIMDDDPTTQSYNQFLHLGAEVTDANKTRYQNLFKKGKTIIENTET